MDFLTNGAIIGVIVTIIILLFQKYLPNSNFHAWGVKAGKKFSAKGNAYLPGNFETLENNLTGSFLSFAQGFSEGADSDD